MWRIKAAAAAAAARPDNYVKRSPPVEGDWVRLRCYVVGHTHTQVGIRTLLPDTNKYQQINLIYQLITNLLLNAIIYFMCVQVQCSHGGIEPRLDPRPLLSHDDMQVRRDSFF